jgi:hypothetical protein
MSEFHVDVYTEIKHLAERYKKGDINSNEFRAMARTVVGEEPNLWIPKAHKGLLDAGLETDEVRAFMNDFYEYKNR